MGTYKDLDVYKLSYELMMRIFILSKGFPHEETYGLIDQIRRSSRSIIVNIGEAYRKKQYPKYFCSKISDADSECAETLIWLMIAKDCRYLDEADYNELDEKYKRVGQMLGRMIQKCNNFSQ